jgi:hypothetical protein
MELITFISVDNVFNNFGTSKQDAVTIFNKVKPRMSQRFTQVAALGKVRNYSRIELLHSFLRRV